MKPTIPESVAHLAEKWKLTNMRPLVPMSPTSNYVVRAYSALYNTDVILKIHACGGCSGSQEATALKLFNGNGVVKLLEYDAQYNGLLLEDITPGNTLSTLFPHDDARALEITIALIKKMQSADVSNHVHEFPTVEQWMEELRTFQSTKIPHALLQKAYRLSQALLSIPYKPTLLHGDLHHENILQSSNDSTDVNAWIIIDPKGVIGPVEFEAIRFMMNPIPGLLEQPNVQDITEHRINQLHTLCGFEKQRLIDWLFVQAVLSACWAEQGGGQEFCNYFIRFAQIVEKMTMPLNSNQPR